MNIFKRTITLGGKKKEEPDNGEHRTVEVLRSPIDGSLSHRFRLKSIYGTFLDV